MSVLSRRKIEITLLDLKMPHLSGEELLPMIGGEFPEVPVIVVTGANDVETAVRCMQKGAYDYMVKPVENSRLVGVVKGLIELRALQRENQRLKTQVLSDALSTPEAFADIITASAAMRSIFRYAEAIAETPRPVLITGETGVGKELIARAIHRLSRRQGAFTPVNAAGLDDNIFADTLFGHRRGAFTDAREARAGLIVHASGGTLFLDEVGDLSPPSQVKLLRLLQDGEFFPLGSDVAKRSDARVVVATNQNLEELQSAGKFRKDLYYRLCAHHIRIPPLRERQEDLPLLVEHFLGKSACTLDKKKPTPPPELITLLGAYSFPGNVRELETMVFDAVSRHQSGILALTVFKARTATKNVWNEKGGGEPGEEAPFWVSFGAKLPTLKQAEQLLIDEALKRSRGNQSIAALSLGISRQALNKRLRKKTIDPATKAERVQP
jgi:DNA-binding NtrC family response regulator